jgi:regulatory protein
MVNMRITDIQEQKKNKDRLSLFLDEKFWIGVSHNLFDDLGIKRGDIIDEKRKEEIENLASEDKAFYWSLNRFSYKQYSEKQLQDKLKEKGYDDQVIAKTVEKCKDLALIDDYLFAETVALERKRKGQGERRVLEYLKRSGIAEKTIKEILPLVFSKKDEREDVRLVLKQKYRQHLNPKEAKQAYNFLLRRGFSPEAVRSVIEKEKMTPDEMDQSYGAKEALELLQRKWPQGKGFTEEKSWRFLLYRGFRSEDIKKALLLYSSSK